jgi:hypothetical protein
MTQSGAWPPIRPEDDLRPFSLPESSGLPLSATEHVEPKSINHGRDSTLAVENGGVVSSAQPSTNLTQGQTGVSGSEPTDDVTSADNLRAALLRDDLSLAAAGDNSNEAEDIGRAHRVRHQLRYGHDWQVLENGRRIPDRLHRLRIRLTAPQNRWRHRLAERRLRRKQPRAHLGSVPTYLIDAGVFSDRQGGAGSHSSLPPDQVEHGSAVLDVSSELIGTELNSPLVPTIEPQHDLGESVVPDRVDGKGLVDLTFHRLDGGT